LLTGSPSRHAAAWLLAASALGCAGDAGRAPDVLTLAVRADVTGFFPNPPINNENYTMQVNWNLLEGLVRFDSKLDLQPAIAEYWETPDDRTYVLHLRHGLRFSDGSALTAEDVVASLDAARRRQWVTRDYLQAVESVRAAGDGSVVIRTRFPYPILLFKLPWGLVLPARALENDPVPMVGTGPYTLDSWQPGREFVLARNPHYRGPAPAFGRVRFVVVPAAADRIRMLEAGEAQIADQVPFEELERLRSHPGLRVFAGPTLRVLYLGLRVDRKPFSDPRVREAVDLAIDRPELSRRALQGLAEPASQLVPVSVFGFNPRIPVTEPDRARARRLLAEAGYPEGLEVRLDGPYNRYVNDREILAVVARQLGEAGFRVEVRAMDKRDFFPLTMTGTSLMHLLGWACTTGEAADALDALVHTTTGGLYGGDNTSGFSDPDLDALIDQINQTVGSRDRRRLLQEALARVALARPVVPLVVQTDAVAVSRRVAWEPSMDFAFRLDEMKPAGP
jgi:peptide/nickel transport system substrate-binding protein